MSLIASNSKVIRMGDESRISLESEQGGRMCAIGDRYEPGVDALDNSQNADWETDSKSRLCHCVDVAER